MYYTLNINANSFFMKGDVVKLISDWGDLLYVENGLYRIALPLNVLTAFNINSNK